MAALLLMVGGALYAITVPTLRTQIVGWAGLLVFGGALPVLVIYLFRRRPVVIVDETGIHDMRPIVGWGTLQWADILSVHTRSLMLNRFLCVEVREGERHLSSRPLL